MPPIRTINQCCIDRAIQQLSFDSALQDLAWRKAQARPRPGPYNAEKRCERRNQNGDVVCEFMMEDVLRDLGIGVDPVAATLKSKRATPANAVSARRWALSDVSNVRSPQLVKDDVLSSLAHKHLLLHLPNAANAHAKAPTSCAEYLKRYSNANRIQLLAELAACLQYLHSRKIIHGSIRPETLFVDDEGFALLRYAPVTDMAASSKPLAPYSAPELQYSHDPVPTVASDVYSFGSIIHWMCTGQDPKPSSRPTSPNGSRERANPNSARASEAASSTLTSSHLSLNSTLSLDLRQSLADWTDNTLKNLVAQCRNRTPSKRPPMVSLVLSLQQIKARHILPTLQNRLSAPLTAPLSTYMPRRTLGESNSPRGGSSEMPSRPRTPRTALPRLLSIAPYRYSPRYQRHPELSQEEEPPNPTPQYYPPPTHVPYRERSPLLANELISRTSRERYTGIENSSATATFSSSSIRECPPDVTYNPTSDSPSLRPSNFVPVPPATASVITQIPPDHWTSQGTNMHLNRSL